jgi:gliding motility-associated-like protein
MGRILLILSTLIFLATGQTYAQPCSCTQPGPNLIVNGDFEDPGTVAAAPSYVGFETDYSMVAPIGTFGTFRWLTNPQSVNSCCWCAQPGTNRHLIFDATTRSGPPSDAAVAPYDVLRYKNIPVIQGGTYYFSFDAMHLAPSYPAAVLTLRINGQIKDVYTVSGGCPNWVKFESCWVADTVAATVVLSEETSQFSGHDFGVDNLFFGLCASKPLIFNGDTTALDTNFCYEQMEHPIIGIPGGGVFSGCGIIQRSGNWYFNPEEAARGATSWPHHCSIVYRLLGGDSVQRRMTVKEPVYVQLGDDLKGCDSMTLQTSVRYSSALYQWNTGATTPALGVSQSGQYWLRVTYNGCEGADSIVVQLEPTPIVSLGADTSICDYDLPYVLTSPQSLGTQYLWSSGFSDPSMEVTRSGRYWLRANRAGCVGSDTVDIEVVKQPEVFLGGDKVICSSRPIRLGSEVAGADYIWSTGATSSHIQVDATGSYWLEIDVAGCKGSDTAFIQAQPDPVVDLGADRYLCSGQEVLLDAGNPGCVYHWSTGSSDPTIQVSTAGLYYVSVVSPDSCIGRDSILLTHLPDPIVSLGSDTMVCEETPLLLKANVLYSDHLLWSDGSQGSTLSVRYGGSYSVAAQNECGVTHDTIEVRQIFCEIWVPNVFTPNGDGRNDVFRVVGNVGRMSQFSLSIFDRWGQRVFYTSDRHQGWDGYYNGSACIMGTYVYLLEYEVNGRPVVEKGNFHLIR